MVTTPKVLGLLAVAFVAGSFVASPELRAYAAATIGSADIIDNSIQSVDIKDGEVKTPDLANNAVTSAKIKDGEVKAAEIAPDAVGASELKGVDKLIFADCDVSATTVSNAPGSRIISDCPVPGVDLDDEVIAMDSNKDCYSIDAAAAGLNGEVHLVFRNTCNSSESRAASHVSIIVYDELPDKVPPG